MFIHIGHELDKNKNVLSWAKSDMAGFSVPYTHPDNTERGYKLDFVAHLNTGVTLVIEGKGKEDDVDKAEKTALNIWTVAVNTEGRYGIWDSVTIYTYENVQTRLENIIRSTEDKKYDHQCQICGLKTKSLVSAVEKFGYEKTHGLLKINTNCKKCVLTNKPPKPIEMKT